MQIAEFRRYSTFRNLHSTFILLHAYCGARTVVHAVCAVYALGLVDLGHSVVERYRLCRAVVNANAASHAFAFLNLRWHNYQNAGIKNGLIRVAVLNVENSQITKINKTKNGRKKEKISACA